MKRKPSRDLQPRSLFWLFRKRLFRETRKYTSGIILTAGVTALFVAMLVVGSSFISASYRAMGTKGPSIFNILYPSTAIVISDDMPRSVNITCGVSDYYAVDRVRLYYSTDFMKTSIPLEGSLVSTNISGHYYRFTIPYKVNVLGVPEQLTYLFFIWANNSAGYFTHADNGQSFFAVRLMEPFTGGYVDPNDPALKQAIQRVQIGIYNATTTRDPRPTASIWIKEASPAWIEINGNPSAQRTGARYYAFTPESNLVAGSNNITFFVLYNGVLNKRTILVNHIVTPITMTYVYPGNGSTIFNDLRWLNFTVNDYISCNVSVSGIINKSWNISTYQRYFALPLEFNKTFGTYILTVAAVDHYKNVASFFINFTFQKSVVPYIHIGFPSNASSVVNMTIGINAVLSEPCNVTVENMNVSGSATSFLNFSSGTLGGIDMTRDWNVINITAENSGGHRNSTLLRVFQQPYLIHKFSFDPFALPGGKLYVDLNYSTNYTAGATGTLWYRFDYAGVYSSIGFVDNGTTVGGVRRGILRATIPVPLDVDDLLFNFTVHFGPESQHYDQNGQDFHVPVDYLYKDLQGPVAQGVPILNPVDGSITSNDRVTITVNLVDMTGVKNATVLYSLNSTFQTNSTINMTRPTGSSNGNGDWRCTLPSHVNGSTVYYRIITCDVLNNTSFMNGQYMVKDKIYSDLDEVVPGLLSPEFEEFVLGAISTLLMIMVLIIVVFIVIFIALNDQNVKREMYREADRIFILKHVCKLDRGAIRKYYYTEQLIQDSIGYGAGALIGFLGLGPLFVYILKITMIKWTIDFQDMFFFSFVALESWVILLLVLFVLGALLLKLVQVDRYVARMDN